MTRLEGIATIQKNRSFLHETGEGTVDPIRGDCDFANNVESLICLPLKEPLTRLEGIATYIPMRQKRCHSEVEGTVDPIRGDCDSNESGYCYDSPGFGRNR